jgi:hypothetical protein
VALASTGAFGAWDGAKASLLAVQASSFGAQADSYVDSSKSTSNYGSSTTLYADVNPAKRSYFLFDVQGISGSVQRATLSIAGKSSSPVAVFAVSDTSWGEQSITWSNAPSLGSALGSLSFPASGGRASIDVSSTVKSSGKVSFALTSAAPSGARFSSREGDSYGAPSLTVETDAGSTATPPANTAAPALSGTAQEGQGMKTTTGTWTGTTPLAYAYQWQRCDSTGGSCASISGATSSSYTVATADVGKTLRAKVTASNIAGSASASSAASAVVQAAPPPPPTPSPPAPVGPSDDFGFSWGSLYLQNESDATLGQDLDTMKAAGAHWLRMNINWSVIQGASPTSYNWAPFDRVVQAAHTRGFNVLGEIAYTPVWALPAGTTDSHYPPKNVSDYVNFARAAVAHYSAMGVHAYEVWNEPNISAFWKPKPDPAAFVNLLRAAYPAIHDADPQATVVSGGLSPSGGSNGIDLPPVTFLTSMYAAGAKGYFDALGDHPYCWPAFPGDAQGWSAWYQMYGTSPSLRSVMQANGDGGKKIWGTEFGAPTNGPAGSYVDEATQAQMITKAYQLWTTYDWAGPLFTYSSRDYGTSTSTRENFFGLLRNDFTAKPSYAGYQAAAGVG